MTTNLDIHLPSIYLSELILILHVLIFDFLEISIGKSKVQYTSLNFKLDISNDSKK